MEIKEILEKIRLNDTYIFPKEELLEAIEKKAEIIPELISIIRNATENSNKLEDSYFAHIYAMYLLAQFREKKAFPVIIDFFSLPGKISRDLTGDIVTESLHRILASVYDGDFSLLKGLIEDETRSKWFRLACLKTLVILVVNNIESREKILNYFYTLFTGGLEEGSSYIRSRLIGYCLNLYPNDKIYEQIKISYEKGLVDIGLIGTMEDVEEEIARGPECLLARTKDNPYFNFINDTISELKSWACFDRSDDLFNKKMYDNRKRQIQNEKIKRIKKKKLKKKMKKEQRKKRKK